MRVVCVINKGEVCDEQFFATEAKEALRHVTVCECYVMNAFGRKIYLIHEQCVSWH